MTYEIPIYRKDKLVKRLEKFNRKALKFRALPIIKKFLKIMIIYINNNEGNQGAANTPETVGVPYCCPF